MSLFRVLQRFLVMANLTHDEERDVLAWLDALDDYLESMARLIGASRIAGDRLRLLLNQNDVPLGSDPLFPLSAEFYVSNEKPLQQLP